jgi:hypothetical protein
METVMETKQKSSRYTGVSWYENTGKWRAAIGSGEGGKPIFLGYFDSEEDAAAAYNVAAEKRDRPEATLAAVHNVLETHATEYDEGYSERAIGRETELETRVFVGATTPEIETKTRQQENAEELRARTAMYKAQQAVPYDVLKDRDESSDEAGRVIQQQKAREARESQRETEREKRWAARQLNRESVRAAIAEEREKRNAAIAEEREARRMATLDSREAARAARKKSDGPTLKLTVSLPKDSPFVSLGKRNMVWDCPSCVAGLEEGKPLRGVTREIVVFGDSVQCGRHGEFEITKLMAGNFLGWGDSILIGGAEKRKEIRDKGFAPLAIGTTGMCKWCGWAVSGQPVYWLGDGVAHKQCPAEKPEEAYVPSTFSKIIFRGFGWLLFAAVFFGIVAAWPVPGTAALVVILGLRFWLRKHRRRARASFSTHGVSR